VSPKTIDDFGVHPAARAPGVLIALSQACPPMRISWSDLAWMAAWEAAKSFASLSALVPIRLSRRPQPHQPQVRPGLLVLESRERVPMP
jgi:hypothetical protein